MGTTSAIFNPAESCPVLARMSGADALGIPPTQEMKLGVDDHGCDFKVFGETSGCYVEWDESADRLNVVVTGRALSSEEHAVDINYTGTLASGGGMVGLDVAVTTAGTAGSWVSGIFAKVTQGTTKNVNGYISGAEFEVINTNTNVSDWFPLVLNANSTTVGSHSSFIALRSYGTLDLNSFLWVSTDFTVGSTDPTVLVTSVSGGWESNCTHAMRMIVGGTPYWFLLSNVTAA